MKRLFDIVVSAILLIVTLPLVLIIGIAVSIGSPGGALFKQTRVGRGGAPFQMLKFRSMRPGSEAKGQITIGNNDPRITGIGKFLRRTKLDELPQLINILKGEMSFVGPRPEVPKYVQMYSADQRKVLDVRPGLTGPASIEFIDENKLLGRSADPERTYVQEVMPAKLALDLKYVRDRNFMLDMKIIGRTFIKLFIPASSRSTRRVGNLRWMYLFLIVSMSVYLTDLYLPPTRKEFIIEKASGYLSQSHTNGRSYSTSYAVVKTINGPTFQVQHFANEFRSGASILLSRSKILNRVLAYQHKPPHGTWFELEAEKIEYSPLPYMILVCAILLWLFQWRDENRWLLQGIMGVSLVTWAFVLFANGAFGLLDRLIP